MKSQTDDGERSDVQALANESVGGDSLSQSSPRALLCPYCGHTQAPGFECDQCGGCFDEWSLRATQDDMGAWYVRDSQRPHFVGFSYEALLAAVEAGELGMHAIVRGPTTRQFWTIARRVPGLAHVFGRCFACQSPVQPRAPKCGCCGAEPFAQQDRNFFGLPSIERVAPPSDARTDLSAFVEDGGVLMVRVTAVVVAASTGTPSRLQSQIVPSAATVTVRSDPALVAPPPPLPKSASHATASPHSALTPLHRGLADRVHKLERVNRVLLGTAAISFLAAIAAVLLYMAKAESHRRELETKINARVNEAVRATRAELAPSSAAALPVVEHKQPELPPMPVVPSSGALRQTP